MISLQLFRKLLPTTQAADVELRITLAAVSLEFKAATGLPWDIETSTEVYEPSMEDQRIFTRMYPVLDLTAPVVSGKEALNDDWEELEEGIDYVWEDKKTGVIRSAVGFSKFVQVECTAGVVEDSEDYMDVWLAICKEVRRRMARDSTDKIAFRTQSSEGGRTVFEDREAVHPEFRRAIVRHRRRGD